MKKVSTSRTAHIPRTTPKKTSASLRNATRQLTNRHLTKTLIAAIEKNNDRFTFVAKQCINIQTTLSELESTITPIAKDIHSIKTNLILAALLKKIRRITNPFESREEETAAPLMSE